MAAAKASSARPASPRLLPGPAAGAGAGQRGASASRSKDLAKAAKYIAEAEVADATAPKKATRLRYEAARR